MTAAISRILEQNDEFCRDYLRVKICFELLYNFFPLFV